MTTTVYAGLTETVTQPGGGTRITNRYLDGNLKRISGTAVVEERYVHTREGNLIHETLQRGDSVKFVEQIVCCATASEL